MTMNKTLLLLCSICGCGTKMWCLMKFLHNQVYSMPFTGLTMCQIMDQEGRHLASKLTTGACGNLLLYNLYKWIVENKAKMNFLHDTIDRSVTLVAHNNKRIKQLGTCTLWVSCGTNTRMVKFFIVDSRLNPIIGLDDSHKLQLVNFNCPHSSILDRTEVY